MVPALYPFFFLALQKAVKTLMKRVVMTMMMAISEVLWSRAGAPQRPRTVATSSNRAPVTEGQIKTACRVFCEARYGPEDDVPYGDVIHGCERALQTSLATKALKEIVKQGVDEWIDCVIIQDAPTISSMPAALAPPIPADRPPDGDAGGQEPQHMVISC